VGHPRHPAVCALVVAAVALLALSVSGCGSRGTETGTGGSNAPATSAKTGGTGVKTIYLAGGCFWGMQGYLDKIHGVTATEVGYANGASNSATYGDSSGYAESVRVEYDPSVAPLPFVLRLFYKAIDPTSHDRQGNDMGTEYRSGIYYDDPADRPVIDASLARLQVQYSAPIAIETGPLKTYSRAEEYHQEYLKKTPGGYCHIPLGLFTEAASARPDPSDFPTPE
jgi:peptide methionine sulfoxide reductase msrA/msrB